MTHDHEVQDIEIRDQMVRLGQLLKLAGLGDSGADVKNLLAEGTVQVNGEVETRRGRQLALGDVVQVGGQWLRVSPAGADGAD